jgi:hypothetical protein
LVIPVLRLLLPGLYRRVVGGGRYTPTVAHQSPEPEGRE